MAKIDSGISQIAVPAPVAADRTLNGITSIHRIQQRAPAWFYSAINWLGQSYYDANGTSQSFNAYLIGSDVDPYAQLGATRLFVITRTDNIYRLSFASDTASSAPLNEGARYESTDAGILQMYLDLAASPIFAAVNFAYVPGRLYTGTAVTFAPVTNLESGYDPSTGIRIIALGSAIAQVVPLGDFQQTHNEQIYDEDPAIVPVVTALVYDVRQNNTLGATTFNLPVYYTRDLIAGTTYVNKIAMTATAGGATANCGQTAIFSGGVGYDDAAAESLNLDSTSIVATNGLTISNYAFDKARVLSILPLLPKVQVGVYALTYSGSSPVAIFASQRITGFYQDPSWTTCSGIPIYDFGSSNSAFTTASAALTTPELIYGPADEFLNGGTLPNVLQKLMQATYVLSADRLVTILDTAIAVKDTSDGVGLSVTTSALDYAISSTGAAAVVNSLAVPVFATVTTTPGRIVFPEPVQFTNGTGAAVRDAVLAVEPPKTITGTSATTVLQSVGSGANTLSTDQLGPSTVQIPLSASVPKEVFALTGITGVEIGTVFAQQSLGPGDTLQSTTDGVAINLNASATPPLASLTLTLPVSGVTLTAGITYVLTVLGTALTVRGSDGSSVSVQLPAAANSDTTHTFVGSIVYTTGVTSATLYPLTSLAFPAPAVGTNGVLQGTTYSLRLTYGTTDSQYDIVDATQTIVASSVTIASPQSTDGSSPQSGGLYFGSFIGGATETTVWNVPVFLVVTPAELATAQFNGAMTLGSQVSGLPAYDLAITDSSLFVYSNINIDTSAVGSVSTANVYLASAVINSAPDDHSAQAFAPCKLLMGLIRQVQMGTKLYYVFVPEDDSVVIGGVRYMLSVINLKSIDEDPNKLPYPPSYWPSTRYWQFANRHNPYVAVEYSGETQALRLAHAQRDIAVIGAELEATQEPMQLFLDTNQSEMTLWPIYAFPYTSATQTVDQGQLKTLTSTILSLLNTQIPVQTATAGLEQITVPGELQQSNPYIYGTSPVATAVTTTAAIAAPVAATSSGQTVTNLSPGLNVIQSRAPSAFDFLTETDDVTSLQDQQSAADVAVTKSQTLLHEVLQTRGSANEAVNLSALRRLQPIYGFSVYNPATGEAYIVEVVDADLSVPDQLPDPTFNTTYDPYYVRVVFLNTLTCYNMSIIVESMARDQYGYLATQHTTYQNVVSRTNEPEIGYTYSVDDAAANFDLLTFSSGTEALALALTPQYLYTNVPYSVATRSTQPPPAGPYFICRRRNWDAECRLMLATHPQGKSVYLAFGDGDLVPFRLDAGVTIDKRQPAHMVEFSYPISDQQYEAAQTVLVGNTPYFVGVTTAGGVAQYTSFSIDAAAGTAGVQVGPTQLLNFPPNIYVVGQATTTLANVADIVTSGTDTSDTGAFTSTDDDGNTTAQFQVVPYNNLVYLIRAVTNVAALADVGVSGAVSGLLIDTYVPATSGNLVLAQGARYKQSGLQYFGSTYTPTTMVDTLDQLDYTSITGETFYAPTIFIPIPELDASSGFVVNLSNFLGQQIWTIIYPEIVAQAGETVNGVTYPQGYNLDQDGKPILSLQKLHFVYDPLALLYTPNDLTHKYPLQPKLQVLALTNSQLIEAICWRTANLQSGRLPPQNVCAQQILPTGFGMDRANIVYSSHNRPVMTSASSDYMGMSVKSFRSVSAAVYNIEESTMQSDQTGTQLVSTVSTVSNMVLGVLFDYDNNELGTLTTDVAAGVADGANRGIVFLNGYLGAAGYAFSSPDHFDVNDVLPSQVPLLDEIADILGNDVAFYNTDASMPRQYWNLAYDTFTAPGIANYLPNVPPAPVDPTFSNRTRSLVLNLQNPVRPMQLGMMDTYSSVVSANVLLQNGITGAIFLSKKADRNIASIGGNPTSGSISPLYGLAGTKYDFYLFTRDHYNTLYDGTFELIDMGYAMCLVDDGTGTGTKIAQYSIDSDGNYYELFYYALLSPSGGIVEVQTFTLKVTLGTPANPNATPAAPAMPNSVNPADLVAQINKLSNVIYAVYGPSAPGQPAAFIPIQAVGGEVQAAPITGAPGFNGYALNVEGANRQPVQISQIYSGTTAYTIAGSTTLIPYNTKSEKAVPFYGSLSHGLDRMLTAKGPLQSADLTTFIPRATKPPGPVAGTFGGNGLGSLISTPFSFAFQGSGAIPPDVTGDLTPGTTMKADDGIFYTFNAITNYAMDTTGKSVTAIGTPYFVDETDPTNPIWGVITLPKFVFNNNTYTVNLSTTLSDGVTSRYTLTAGNKTYQFGPDNTQVTVDRTVFTFPKNLVDDVYTVTYAALDAPAVTEAPTPITITPFSMTAGGLTTTIDVFNNQGGLKDVVLGPIGRLYTYDPIHGIVTVSAGTESSTATVQTGLAFVSNSFFGYVIGNASGDDSATLSFTVNGEAVYPYSAWTTGAPASYPLMTSPQMFTIGGNVYTFDTDQTGDYLSVTGNGQIYPVNPYQFSIDGIIYIINTNVQPYTVVGGGNVYPMTAANTQFVLDGVQYTITLKAGSLNGATISGQFNITQGNVVVVEDYAYELDVQNGQIVGNGTAYPLTTSGSTYTIATGNQSFTVTTEANATTVKIGNIVYQINNTTVVADGVTYPILPYRTFVDGTTTYTIGADGTADLPGPLALSGVSPYTNATFADGATTYTVNAVAAFDGTNYYLISGTPAQFTTASLTYQLRTDGVSIAAGPVKTYVVTSGALSPNSFTFGSQALYFGRATDIAAFNGTNYFAIVNGSFTDTTTSLTYTISGNTAVNEGNSYEIYSNLGTGDYFEVPGGPTYFVNVAVADSGTPTGTIYEVFPVTAGAFTIPLVYTVTVSDTTATVNATTFTGGATVLSSLTASGGKLTGGFFTDPFTKIVYTCVVDAGTVTFVDSNNTIYPYPATGMTDAFVASVLITTAVNLAVDNEATPDIYPVVNNQFETATETYTVNVPVAYASSAGPFLPIVNGRFIVPQTAPISNTAYTIRGGSVIKGYVVSNDDAFSADGNLVYTVNAVNVVRASNLATLIGTAPNQTLSASTATYALNSTTSLASTEPAGVTFNTATQQFTAPYNGSPVTYTLAGTTVSDNRRPVNAFTVTVSGSQVTFTDTVSGVTFTFNDGADNPVTAEFTYSNGFFVDAIAGTTFYIDETTSHVEAISYLPETTQYAFTAADGNTYLIHYNDVDVVFPVISGANVNAGVATVGSDMFTIQIDAIDPASGSAPILIDPNSFEVNGNLYTITGTPAGADYSACSVVGAGMAPQKFLSTKTFKLSDPTIVYTLQLDANNLPESVVATFPVLPSRDLISISDNVYLITYSGVSSGSLLGQGQSSIAIANSGFTLTNPFDTTKAKFVFDDLDIYDAGSGVGQFTVYLSPTFFMGSATYTLDTVHDIVTDNNKHPYPLIPNPTMFSINGFNYVIDTNRVPHAIVGNNNASPLSTDVTVQSGVPVENSTFTLNGQVYAYVEDAQHDLLTIVGTKLYPIAQPGLTFKLDSSLIFTLSTTPPATGSYAGTTVPIGTVTSGTVGPITSATTILNLYAGTSESGGADFFMYKNVLYTLIKSSGTYTAVQKSYTVYAASPVKTQQQLAVFDLGGTTYIATDGTSAGAASPLGINPGTMWSQTFIGEAETQFGLVYGFTAQPTNVTLNAKNVFQFSVTNSTGTATLYDIIYTAGSNANLVEVDVPQLLPTFTQSAVFSFVNGNPLMFETGGYNAFTTSVDPTQPPVETFAGAFKTPLIANDAAIDALMSPQGDFTLEFWHSLSLTPVADYHPVTYAASTNAPLVYYVDMNFASGSEIDICINGTVMRAITTPPVFSSRWRHVALTYDQPYTIACQGAGYEVVDGSNYDVTGDFSIAMTFAAQDVTSEQGLLYKGTGSPNTSPALDMSYRLEVNGGAVALTVTESDGTIPDAFVGPAIDAQAYYQVIVVKHGTTPATGTNASSTDPYLPPFDSNAISNAATAGGSANFSSLPTSGGSVNITKMAPISDGTTPMLSQFETNVAAGGQTQNYTVAISVRKVHDDGTFDPWQTTSAQRTVNASSAPVLNSTGSAHLLIGMGYDDSGTARPLGNSGAGGATPTTGNVRDLYLFNGAIDPHGIKTKSGGVIDIAAASSNDLQQSGIVGYWQAQYDPNGVVQNAYDETAVAISTNAAWASLYPLSGHEFEGTSLYVNGFPMPLTLVTGGLPSMTPYAAGESLLNFNAGAYRLEEISIWSMTRQQYQILDDMFGRLITPQPFLNVYLSGSLSLQRTTAPALPMNALLDGVIFQNAAEPPALNFTPASLDLIGSPAVGRCGPLIAPNLYTPPGVALTVCDTVPALTSYSVTLNTTAGTLAGEINEAYVYVRDNVLMLYAGKKVGDLTLSWVSQEQGDVQIIGYVEGAPPVPMANLTAKASYAGATSVTLTAPTSVSLKYQKTTDTSSATQIQFSDKFGMTFGMGASISPMGFGVKSNTKLVHIALTAGTQGTTKSSSETNSELAPSVKLEESNKYTVKMEGAISPYTGDLFMASVNTLTTPSTTVGTPSSKTAILPNPNLGGFTTSNPAGALPKGAVTDEKFGQRMFVPSPYGQAFVTSQTLDVYQQTLVQSGTTYGYIAVPNAQIPRDLNIVSFRMNSQYIRPGCLDGMIGYAYNPATLPSGAQTYTTSTGQMSPLYDKNFAAGLVGHDASYMQVVQAYQVKKEIDQQTFNTLALYQAAQGNQDPLPDPNLTPAFDFYNEYVWSSRGGTQEVKHTASTTYNTVYTTSDMHSAAAQFSFNAKITAMFVTVADAAFKYTMTNKNTIKYSYTSSATSSFDVAASFAGIESDTQMKYSSNNDAHFVMNYNSMFNPDNQSGLNLVIGSDGLIYQIVPSVTSGAGLPTSNNLDTSESYTQPQPAYTTGNADGLTGNLEPYDRPGKTNLFRTYTYFLQPDQQNAQDFWETVIDPVWLANSPDADAATLRTTSQTGSVPWRLFYRVTYSERFLPPVADATTATPQITPLMAVPVLNPASEFLFQSMTATGARPAMNPANDIEANVVLVSPTASGWSAGTIAPSGSGIGLPVQPNNVIPFDLLKNASIIANWGDTTNAKLLSQVIMSALGTNLVAMTPTALPGSTLVAKVSDPVNGGVLYSIYLDPNGLTVNVPTNFGISVFADVNGNPIQYFDGKTYHSLQADYVPSPDGTLMYYIQPPSTYDQTTFNLSGDYDPFTHPGDEWRYFLVSGMSSDMTSASSFSGNGPFLNSSLYSGLTVAPRQHDANTNANQVAGYVLVQGVLQWPNLNTAAETFADVFVYKSMSLLDTFPIGDPNVLIEFLTTQYPTAPFVRNDEINDVFARNITSYFNTLQQALLPE